MTAEPMTAESKADLSALYAAYRQPVLQFLRRRLSDHGRAEELMQDAFIRMGGLMERTAVVVNPRAALFTIASNLLIDTLRKEKLRHSTSKTDWDESDEFPWLQPLEVRLDDQRRLDWLCDAIAQLPPRCREAFLLRKIEGLSYDEVATRMEISVKTVEKHLMQGLLECRAYLDAKEKNVHPIAQARARKRIRDGGATP